MIDFAVKKIVLNSLLRRELIYFESKLRLPKFRAYNNLRRELIYFERGLLTPSYALILI